MEKNSIFVEKEYYRHEIIELIYEIDRVDVLLYLYVIIKGTKEEVGQTV